MKGNSEFVSELQTKLAQKRLLKLKKGLLHFHVEIKGNRPDPLLPHTVFYPTHGRCFSSLARSDNEGDLFIGQILKKFLKYLSLNHGSISTR